MLNNSERGEGRGAAAEKETRNACEEGDAVVLPSAVGINSPKCFTNYSSRLFEECRLLQ